MGRWHIELNGLGGDWMWKKVEDDGTVSMQSAHTFRYYLDCYLDAERHGMGRVSSSGSKGRADGSE